MKTKQSNNRVANDHDGHIESSRISPKQQLSLEAHLDKKAPLSFWQSIHHWWTSATFVPGFLSGPWRHPLIGYLATLILQVMVIGGIALFAPSFHFPGSVALLVILLIAYGWGAGASFFATLVGSVLLIYWFLMPRSFFTLGKIEDLFGIITYIIGGLAVGVLISQMRRAQSVAEIEMHEQVRARKQVEELLDALAANATQLDSIFEAMTDGVVFYNTQGHVLRNNQSYKRMIGLDNNTHLQLTAKERGEMLDLRDEQGKPLSDEQQPVQRMLSGEVFVAGKAMDIQLSALDGNHKQLNITGTAIYDQAHNLTGGVLIFRDVTDRRILERQSQEALKALLMMAEELVKLPDQDENTDRQMEASVEIAQRLVKLICQIMNCKRVSITAFDERTQTTRLLAVSGLSPDKMQLVQEPGSRLSDILLGTPFANAIYEQEVLVLDFSQPLLNTLPNFYDIRTMLLVPMRIGSRPVGMLALDHAGEEHQYTKNERTFAKAVGDLVALIIERESLLAQRAEARANEMAAREATVLMEEFLGIAGHELRTPLTTIKAGIQLAMRQTNRLKSQPVLLTSSVSSAVDAIQGLLQRTERQVGIQNRLINDLLDVSRIQTGRLELHPELIDVTQVVQQVVEDQHDLLPDRALRYTATTPGEILVFADTDRLRQVITNYLTNALKYSTVDKPVEVCVDCLERSVRISVKDEGPGLTIEQQQRIWERFYRVPGIEVKSGSSVGLGLGLHISRMIIERQGGHVGVESTPGEGCTFWFTLPLAQ